MEVWCDGVKFKIVKEPELVNVGSPATAKFMALGYMPDAEPDEFGFYDLYDIFYEGDDPEKVDWSQADYFLATGGNCNQTGYDPVTGHIC